MIRNKIIRAAVCIMGIVFMVTGIRMIIGGPVEYIQQRNQVDWPEIRAEVVDISSRVESTGTRHSVSTTYYDLTIQYEVNGKTYTCESRNHRKIRQIGDGITVKCNPDAPGIFTATLAPSVSDMVMLMVFGAVFTVLGFFCFRRIRADSQMAKKRKTGGEGRTAPGRIC